MRSRSDRSNRLSARQADSGTQRINRIPTLAVLFTSLPSPCPPILRLEPPAGLNAISTRPLTSPRQLFASADFAELTLIQCKFGGSQDRAVRRTAAKLQPRRVN